MSELTALAVDANLLRERVAALRDKNATLERALVAATARAEAADRRTQTLRAAFIAHRQETHRVKPQYCETCHRSDAALAAAAPGNGGEWA